jgi:hypothetical protein
VVLEPAIDVTVTYDGSLRSGARVYAYPKTPDCDGTRVRLGITDSTGKIPADTEWGPGLPFGTYDVCVHYNDGSRLLRMHWSGLSGAAGPTISNTAPAGVSRTAALRSNGTNTTGCGTNTPTS